jgi:hypothetical protein
MKPNPVLVADRLLLMLSGAGPRTNSELIILIGSQSNTVRAANSMNAARGFVSYAHKSGINETEISLTEEGIARVEHLKLVRFPKPDTIRSKPMKTKLLRAISLKKGVNTKSKNFGTIDVLQKNISILRSEGHTITLDKEGLDKVYRLLKPKKE